MEQTNRQTQHGKAISSATEDFLKMNQGREVNFDDTLKHRRTAIIELNGNTYNYDISDLCIFRTLKKMIQSSLKIRRSRIRFFTKDDTELNDMDDVRISEIFPGERFFEIKILLAPTRAESDSIRQKAYFNNFCELHVDRYLANYCYTCKKSICLVCIQENSHNNHDLIEKFDYLKCSKLLVDKQFRDVTDSINSINILEAKKVDILIENNENYFDSIIEMMKNLKIKSNSFIKNYAQAIQENGKTLKSNLALVKNTCEEGLDELKERLVIQNIISCEETFLEFDEKYKSLTNCKEKILADKKVYEQLNDFYFSISESINNLYDDINDYISKKDHESQRICNKKMIEDRLIKELSGEDIKAIQNKILENVKEGYFSTEKNRIIRQSLVLKNKVPSKSACIDASNITYSEINDPHFTDYSKLDNLQISEFNKNINFPENEPKNNNNLNIQSYLNKDSSNNTDLAEKDLNNNVNIPNLLNSNLHTNDKPLGDNDKAKDCLGKTGNKITEHADAINFLNDSIHENVLENIELTNTISKADKIKIYKEDAINADKKAFLELTAISPIKSVALQEKNDVNELKSQKIGLKTNSYQITNCGDHNNDNSQTNQSQLSESKWRIQYALPNRDTSRKSHEGRNLYSTDNPLKELKLQNESQEKTKLANNNLADNSNIFTSIPIILANNEDISLGTKIQEKTNDISEQMDIITSNSFKKISLAQSNRHQINNNSFKSFNKNSEDNEEFQADEKKISTKEKENKSKLSNDYYIKDLIEMNRNIEEQRSESQKKQEKDGEIESDQSFKKRIFQANKDYYIILAPIEESDKIAVYYEKACDNKLHNNAKVEDEIDEFIKIKNTVDNEKNKQILKKAPEENSSTVSLDDKKEHSIISTDNKAYDVNIRYIKVDFPQNTSPIRNPTNVKSSKSNAINPCDAYSNNALYNYFFCESAYANKVNENDIFRVYFLFITGGFEPNAKVDSSRFLKFDSITKDLYALPDMLEARSYHSMIENNNLIYVIGGKGKSSCEKYDIEKKVWTKLPNLKSDEKRNTCLYIHNSYLYSFFGYTNSKYCDAVERLNLKMLKSWDVINYKNEEKLNLKMIGCGMYVGKENPEKLFILGGKNNEGKAASIIVYEFDNRKFFKENILNIGISYFKESKFFKLNNSEYGNFDSEFFDHVLRIN